MQWNRNSAVIIAVADGKKGKHADECMFDRMDSAHEVEFCLLDSLSENRFDFRSESDGFQMSGVGVREVFWPE